MASVALGCALGACSFAPPYPKAPETAVPPQAYQETGDWKLAQPADALPRGAWWTLFGDPELDALENQLGNANQDVKAAFARLVQARAQTRVARADLFPTVTVGPGLTRTRESTHAPHYVAGTPTITNDFTLEADLDYEVDVWGRVRNTISAAKATAQASAGDLASVDLAARAELASDYFMLRSFDARQELLDQTVADYGRALQLEQNLYHGGAAAAVDVSQAEAQLETAKTQSADTHLQRAQLEHAIALLVGESASSFHLAPKALPTAVAPPAIDPGLPSALLERRPDVAAAERRVAASNAEIGVARAAFFPVFSLSAVAGFESTTASNWIEAPSRLWAIGPKALLTVFDAGRRSALADQARAAYEESVANYRSSVLGAYRDVEDGLAALRQLEHEAASEGAAVAATQSTLKQALNRYKGGVATYLEVVSAQNAALAAELSAADIQARRLDASVLLIKALGGGWQNTTDAATPVSAQTASASN